MENLERLYMEETLNQLKFNLKKNKGVGGFVSLEEFNSIRRMVDYFYNKFVKENGDFNTAQ